MSDVLICTCPKEFILTLDSGQVLISNPGSGGSREGKGRGEGLHNAVEANLIVAMPCLLYLSPELYNSADKDLF